MANDERPRTLYFYEHIDCEYFSNASERAPGKDRGANDGLQTGPDRSQGRHGTGSCGSPQEGCFGSGEKSDPRDQRRLGGQLGVLVEINCESDFVARTEDFKELAHDIAMHIAASDPKFVRKEDVTPE